MATREQGLAKSIGRAVSSRRIKKGLTQGDVAEKLGVDTETIGRIERGVTIPPIPRLAEIADVLGCSPADLLRAGSPRISERAQSLGAQLQGLSDSDAKLLFEMVEMLITRLKKRG